MSMVLLEHFEKIGFIIIDSNYLTVTTQ